MNTSPSCVHVGDAAQTGARLVERGRAHGLKWDVLPLASTRTTWHGPVATVRRAVLGSAWLLRLGVAARTHEIVHVHSASTVQHSRIAAPRFVLHCHGSDVRTTQYDPLRGPAIRRSLSEAEAVLYSTPDLARHVVPHRRDAVYLPVPVNVDGLPHWQPMEGRPRILFASRWEDTKGLSVQLEAARRVVAAVGDSAVVVGLEWGPGSAEAAAAGVHLEPRRSHEDYLTWLSGASAVVGQATGSLGSSELEAIGVGAPLLVPVALAGYEGLTRTPPPVFGGTPESVAEAVTALVGRQQHDAHAARDWVRAEHGVEQALERVIEVYYHVLARRDRNLRTPR